MFTLSLEGEPAGNGCGLYLEPAGDEDRQEIGVPPAKTLVGRTPESGTGTAAPAKDHPKRAPPGRWQCRTALDCVGAFVHVEVLVA